MCGVKVNSSLGGSFDQQLTTRRQGTKIVCSPLASTTANSKSRLNGAADISCCHTNFLPHIEKFIALIDRRFSPVLLSTAKNLIFACSKPLDRCDVPSDKGTYNGAGVAFNDAIKRNPGCLLANIVRFVRLSRRSQKNHASMTLRTKFDWIFGR